MGIGMTSLLIVWIVFSIVFTIFYCIYKVASALLKPYKQKQPKPKPKPKEEEPNGLQVIVNEYKEFLMNHPESEMDLIEWLNNYDSYKKHQKEVDSFINDL